MAPHLLLSTRGALVFLLFLCNANLYAARAVLSVAIVFIAPSKPELSGQLLSAFFIGYVL